MRKTAYRSLLIPSILAATLAATTLAPATSLASDPPLPPSSRIAVLPPGGDAEGNGKLARLTVKAVAKTFRQMGHQVIAPDEVSQQLAGQQTSICPSFRYCDQQAVLRALQVDAVASVAVWLDEKGSQPHKVVVRVTRRENWGVGEALLGESDLASALGAASAMALKDTERRHHITLRIEAEPDHARIQVDHKRVGLTPAQVEVLPGKRTITVSASGYVTESDFVEIPEDPSQVVVHTVRLTADTDAPTQTGSDSHFDPRLDPALAAELDADSSTSERASVWNYAAGGALIVVAVPLTVIPLVVAAREGECYEQPGDGRCSRYYFGTQSSLMLAGGLLALGGGVAFIIIRPIDGPSAEKASPLSFRPKGEISTHSSKLTSSSMSFRPKGEISFHPPRPSSTAGFWLAVQASPNFVGLRGAF